jgi:hypothetical protein
MNARVVLIVLAVVTFSQLVGTGQSPKNPTVAKPARATATSQVPRTPDGHPDLQGTWDYSVITPMERPAAYGDRAFLTDEEAATLEERARNRGESTPKAGDPGAYNSVWIDSGTKVAATRRTSLIIDPPNGRFPALTPEGLKEDNERQAFVALDRADNPEDRDLGERCILGLNSGPPMMPGAYNNMMQLFQTRDYVAILTEMNHDARIVPLGGQPHLPNELRQWNGDSSGRWEGDTLVVETTNFSPKTHGFRSTILRYHGYAGAMRLIERFSRPDVLTLMYEATIDNPAVYTRPWTFQVPMIKTDEHVLEYACHEGNYGLFNILSGARAKDAENAGKPAAR